MKLKLLCSSVSGQSNKPGVSVKVLRFQNIPAVPASENAKAIPSPNAEHFKDGDGNINFDVMNLTKNAHGAFEEGKCYIVEIREAGPTE